MGILSLISDDSAEIRGSITSPFLKTVIIL